MGRILNGILGGVSGKVSGVVGSKWKDIKYLRAYAVPANPDTPDQQIQRSRMRSIVAIARQLIGTLIQPYWNPFYSSMSGFNAFVKYNIMHLTSNDYYLSTDNQMARGNLLGVADFSATYNTSTGEVAATWVDNSNGSTGLITDNAFFVVAKKDGTILLTDSGSETRGSEAYGLSVPTGLSASDLIVYLFYFRGTGSAVQVSDSSAVVPSAA
ncbi:MAG: hypothetical protein J5I57_08265 [Melioribacteraceae bacterium]|nr:hypothetical protein [Melioribacteraceae bacterium]